MMTTLPVQLDEDELKNRETVLKLELKLPKLPKGVLLSNGPIFGEQVNFYVEPESAFTYVVCFSDPAVFGEPFRVLHKGTNMFTRVAGETKKTAYQVIEMKFPTDEKNQDPIPPKG